jgi:hypothetical protein
MLSASRWLFCAALAGIALAQSPRERALMLPSPVRLTGVVRDNEGKALPGVWINHTGVRVENVKTDSQGRFDIQNWGPAIVFRKEGYQSKYWPVSGDREMAIALSGPAPRLKPCAAFSRCLGLSGFMSVFCLPKVRGVNVSKRNNDVDYGQRVFWIKTPDGVTGVQHAAGMMWGGLPLDEDVWSARDYVERDYQDSEGFGILDARGKSAEGKCWRVLGRVFETASYRDVREQDTGLLDRVIDGACVEPIRPKPPR